MQYKKTMRVPILIVLLCVLIFIVLLGVALGSFFLHSERPTSDWDTLDSDVAEYYTQSGITEEVYQTADVVEKVVEYAPGKTLRLLFPPYWEKLYQLEVDPSGTFILRDKYNFDLNGMGQLWSIHVYTFAEYEQLFSDFPLPAAYEETIGANSAIIGTDEDHVYLLSLPTDVQTQTEDVLAQKLYQSSMKNQEEIISKFLKANQITVNQKAPKLN